ncbi:MAG: helix-turn-helix transcriptional regulator [Chloroflexi bacterium]|nr:helix-turn-helix transcriptional regulator [Chloroflexota bacterium]
MQQPRPVPEEPGGEEPSSPLLKLSRREMDVLRLVVKGMTSQEAAGALGLSAHTVHRHRANIMRKLAVRNVAQLVNYVLRFPGMRLWLD